jgi:hypothetical protein
MFNRMIDALHNSFSNVYEEVAFICIVIMFVVVLMH